MTFPMRRGTQASARCPINQRHLVLRERLVPLPVRLRILAMALNELGSQKENANGRDRGLMLWTALDDALAIIVTIAFAAVFLWCAISTVRFGKHWDEWKIIQGVQETITSGVVLPAGYNWPSLTYLIALFTSLANLPAVVEAGSVAAAKGQLADIVGSPPFTYQLRVVFAVLTASTGLFAVLAARAIGTSWLAASISGAVVLSSFQVLYHSRWIAPDSLVMLACAMTLAAALQAARDQRRLPLLLAAVAAGLATAAKYPGGCLLLLPLIAAARGPAVLARLTIVLAVFAATYLIITPGTIVDSARFVADVLFEIDHYNRLGHGGYTVEAGWPHLAGILDFVAFRLASPYPIVSVLVLTAAVAGGAVAWCVNRYAAVFLTAVPVLYIVYMATNRVLIVRNLLILVPFVAILVAVAVDKLARLFQSVTVRVAIPVAAATLLALNWPIFLHAAASMHDLDVESWRRSIATYVAEHPDRRFAVSPRVAALLFERPEARSAVTVYPPERSDAYIYVLGEHHARIANRRNTYRVVAGPDDVDLDYYPTWLGLERIVVVDGPVASLLTGLRFVGKAEVPP